MSEIEYKTIFSKKLKYYMQLRNKTQTDLVHDLHLSQSTVSNWCTGTKLPRMPKIQMLADYFNIEKSDLLEDDKGEKHSDEYNRVTHLCDLYYKGILVWSEEIGINEQLTCIIREHLSDLLSRYKLLIEHFSYKNIEWKEDKVPFSNFYLGKDNNMSQDEIFEIYLRQGLNHEITTLQNWINAFPVWISSNISKSINDDLQTEPNAIQGHNALMTTTLTNTQNHTDNNIPEDIGYSPNDIEDNKDS